MRYRKAQISGLDLILALMLFFTVVLLFTILWDLTQYNVRTSADADLVAWEVADKLLGNPGVPYNWNATNVQIIGLASERGVMDQIKFVNFLTLLNTSYDEVRQMLDLGPYQLCINMTYPDGSPVIINNQTAQGGNCAINATSVSSVRRTALYGEIVVHNNSVTFIFDSSGSMDWYSTSINYTNNSITLINRWINIYNVTLPSSYSDNFDFVLEFNDTNLAGGSDVLMNITSPRGVTYLSNGASCNAAAGCWTYAYAGAVRMNFSKSLWNSSGVWKVGVEDTRSGHPIAYDLLVQTPPRRIDAAKNATQNFAGVIATESQGGDEMSLYNFSKDSSHINCPNNNMVKNFTTDYVSLNYSIGNLSANGATPIANITMRAADSINASYYTSTTNRTHAMMIIVSDGSETCNLTAGATSDAASYAMNKVRIQDFRICTVGFAQGSIGEVQLKQMASIGNCQYYHAMNEQELEMALRQIYFGQLQKQTVLLTIVVWR